MSPYKDPFNPDFRNIERQQESLESLDQFFRLAQKQAETERKNLIELYPSYKGIPNLQIGEQTIPIDRLPSHIGFQGVTRSGKSMLMNILIASIFKARTKRIFRNKNIVIFDSKNDYGSWAKALAEQNGIEYRVIKFGDPTSYCLDIASLVGNDPTLMMNLAKTILPTPNDGQKFWALMGQSLIVVVIQALVRKYGDCWGFHDLYDTVLTSLDDFYKMVETTPEGKAFISRYFPEGQGNENVKYGVLSEFSATISNLRPAAELQRHTPKERWLKVGQIIADYDTCTTISSTPCTDAALRPLVQFMFQTLTDEISGLPENYNKYISLVIDELPFWGKLPALEKQLQFNPSKGVRAIISWQDYGNIEHIYSPALARAITGNIAFQVYLRAASPSSAEYAIASMGKRRVTQRNVSYSASGINISESQGVQTPFETGDLYDLPLASPYDGIYYILNAPNNFGGIAQHRMDAAAVQKMRPDKAKKGGGLLSKLFGLGDSNIAASSTLPSSYTKSIDSQDRYMAVRGMVGLLGKLDSDRAYAEYMSACTTATDKLMAEMVWKTMQQTVGALTERILRK